MPEKIHYGNNIFFLTSFIKTLNDAVRINVDPEYFAEKILEDALFIDSSIQRLYLSLNENPHLINKKNNLHTIMKLKKKYAALLENLLAKTGEFAKPFESSRSKLQRIIANHLNEASEIQKNLQSQLQKKNEVDLITENEMEFLLQPFEETD